MQSMEGNSKSKNLLTLWEKKSNKAELAKKIKENKTVIKNINKENQ